MTKKTISQDGYLCLVGLLTLAAGHRKVLTDIAHSATRLLGSVSMGHVGDVVWGGTERSADELLDVLGITVERPSTTPATTSHGTRSARESILPDLTDGERAAIGLIDRQLNDLGSES